MKSFILSALITFIALTIMTSENHAACDGTTSYGFPEIFYKYAGGKTTAGNEYETYAFIPINFLIDLSYASVIGVLVLLFKKVIKKPKTDL